MEELFRQVENKNLPCHVFGYILDAEEVCNFFDTMDIYLSALGDGVAELEIPVSKMQFNRDDVVHSAAFAALLDATMGMAVLTKNKKGTIASMQVQYLQTAGKGEVLQAEAKVTDDGAEQVQCEAVVRNQRGDVLATAQGTFTVQISDFVQYYAAKLRENGYQ